MSLARELPFFGRAGGVVTALQKVSKTLNLPTNISPTEDLTAIAAALSGPGKAALAGPLGRNDRAAYIGALKLHTRVFRGFGTADIPKLSGQDLYAGFDANIVWMQNAATNPVSGEIAIMEKSELRESKETTEQIVEMSQKTIKEAVDVTLKSRNRIITLCFKEGFQMAFQETMTTALMDTLEPKDGSGALPIAQRAQRPGTLCNELIMYPDRVGTVLLPPLTFAEDVVRCVEGMLGGASMCNWVWKGDDGDLFHPGAFKDGDKANPVGALLAFCSLLAQRGHKDEANALYNSVRTVASQHCTHQLAQDKGVAGFADEVSAQIQKRKK